MTAIEFTPISKPYMHGVKATHGDRAVEVVKVYEMEWTVFKAIGGKTVNGQVHPYGPNVDKAEAMKIAKAFLLSKEPMTTWDSPSDIGK